MFVFSLIADFHRERVEDSLERYGLDFEEGSAEAAARIMADGMGRSSGGGPSAPGGFPNSINGELRDGIGWSRDGEGVIVGPEIEPMPEGYSLTGADSIPEALNRGASVTIRRRDGRRRVRVRRFEIRPRPFVDLTLQTLAGQLPGIAQQTPLREV